MTCRLVALATALLFCVVSPQSTRAELRWNSDYARARSAAQAAKRPMVVVLENPRQPDQKLDVTKLSASEKKRLENQQFELCRVNVATKYGKQVAEAFGASEFPYTAVTDRKSRLIVFRKAGQMSPTDWKLALVKSATSKNEGTTSVESVQAAKPVIVSDFGTPVSGGFIVPPQGASSATCFT